MMLKQIPAPLGENTAGPQRRCAQCNAGAVRRIALRLLGQASLDDAQVVQDLETPPAGCAMEKRHDMLEIARENIF